MLYLIVFPVKAARRNGPLVTMLSGRCQSSPSRATESAGTVRFNLLAKDGSRLKQQYVSEKDQTTVVPRSEMVKGYEFEKDRYVLFGKTFAESRGGRRQPRLSIGCDNTFWSMSTPGGLTTWSSNPASADFLRSSAVP